MVNTNKILTVSYGTFSCTLEGFDDSFGTMKAIAEYFRDLAADDRYFGAEPPSPDAEMLARIAEREIARRVEAHREDNTFVLRADTQGAAPAPAEKAAEEDKAAKAETPRHQEKLAAPQSDPAPHEAPAEASDSDTVEEPTPHKTEDTSETAEAEAPVAPTEAKSAEIAGLSALVAESAESQASSDAQEVIVSQDSPIDESEEDSPEEAEAEPADDQPMEQADTVPATQTAGEADSVAAKLQRIRDVVSRNETASAPGDYTEDEHANDILSDEEAASEDFLTGAQDDIAAALAADDEAEAAQPYADEEAEERGTVADAGASTDQEDDFTFSEEDDEDDDISALLDKLSATDAAGETDPANDAPSVEAFVEHDEDGSLDDWPEEQAEDTNDENAPAPRRARVIKMKKADFEAAVAGGQLEEDLDNEDTDDASKESSLSPDEEDELMRELAAVEAELAQGQDSPQDTASDDDYDAEDYDGEPGDDTVNLFSDEAAKDEVDDAEAEIASAIRSERSAQLSETDTEEEMGRILEETNTKLEEDEGRGRRSAIAHLRAAVKATKAERDIGGDLGASGRDTEVYRDDLETAVRPRRPKKATQTARPNRPAPLKLVAEQRIDTPKPGTPVQPRRVRVPQVAEAAATNADESFADYVEMVGAHNLSEVLEAAASYMAFVEGHDAFSRPQLMQKLGETDHADTSREDRLRSFGQLLRAGKIRKLGSGRFEAAEDISYRPAS